MLVRVKGGWSAVWVKTQGRTIFEEEILSNGPESRPQAMERVKIALARRLILGQG